MNTSLHRLYRPRTVFEAVRDIASAAATIWADYRHESGYQRAMKKRLRKDLAAFSVRCSGRMPSMARPRRKTGPVLTVAAVTLVAVVSTIALFAGWPAIADAADSVKHLVAEAAR